MLCMWNVPDSIPRIWTKGSQMVGAVEDLNPPREQRVWISMDPWSAYVRQIPTAANYLYWHGENPTTSPSQVCIHIVQVMISQGGQTRRRFFPVCIINLGNSVLPNVMMVAGMDIFLKEIRHIHWGGGGGARFISGFQLRFLNRTSLFGSTVNLWILVAGGKSQGRAVSLLVWLPGSLWVTTLVKHSTRRIEPCGVWCGWSLLTLTMEDLTWF